MSEQENNNKESTEIKIENNNKEEINISKNEENKEPNNEEEMIEQKEEQNEQIENEPNNEQEEGEAEEQVEEMIEAEEQVENNEEEQVENEENINDNNEEEQIDNEENINQNNEEEMIENNIENENNNENEQINNNENNNLVNSNNEVNDNNNNIENSNSNNIPPNMNNNNNINQSKNSNYEYQPKKYNSLLQDSKLSQEDRKILDKYNKGGKYNDYKYKNKSILSYDYGNIGLNPCYSNNYYNTNYNYNSLCDYHDFIPKNNYTYTYNVPQPNDKYNYNLKKNYPENLLHNTKYENYHIPITQSNYISQKPSIPQNNNIKYQINNKKEKSEIKEEENNKKNIPKKNLYHFNTGNRNNNINSNYSYKPIENKKEIVINSSPCDYYYNTLHDDYLMKKGENQISNNNNYRIRKTYEIDSSKYDDNRNGLFCQSSIYNDLLRKNNYYC